MDGVLVVLNKGECRRPVCTCTMFMLLSPQRYNRPHMCPAIAAKVQGGPGGVGSCGYMYSPSLPSRLSADCEDQARCEYCFTDLAESKTACLVRHGGRRPVWCLIYAFGAWRAAQPQDSSFLGGHTCVASLKALPLAQWHLHLHPERMSDPLALLPGNSHGDQVALPAAAASTSDRGRRFVTLLIKILC
jgi:hypothetical protein